MGDVSPGALPAGREAPSGRWVSLLLLAFGLAILAGFAATANFRQIGEALRRIQVVLLGGAIAALMLQLLVKAV
ncbi:MAG TPA: hypothetical protein VGA35_00050, partial [bacterium]